jgi:hypothetical protein
MPPILTFENRLVEGKIEAPIGIPVGFFEKRLLRQLPRRPLIENDLVGEIEHFHPDRHPWMNPQEALEDLELNFVVGRIGVNLADVDDPASREIGEHLVEGHRRARGARNDLTGLDIAVTVFQKEPRGRSGAGKDKTGQKCCQEYFSDHLSLFRHT